MHIKAHSEYTYFERRDAWATLRASLTSPMTLMLIVSVVAAIWLPKAMDGLSEDEKQVRFCIGLVCMCMLGGGKGQGADSV